MELDIKQFELRNANEPKIVFPQIFPKHQWPISGGWGYDENSAMVIEESNEGLGVAMEYKVLEYRTYIEMIVTQPIGHQYSGFRFEKGMQALMNVDGRSFDVVTMHVTCFTDEDFEMLKNRYTANHYFIGDPVGKAEHFKLHEEKMIHFDVTGWFDISHFFGNH